MHCTHWSAALVLVSLVPAAAAAQQVVKPAIARYAVDVGTRNMSIPGMPSGGMAGMMMPSGMGPTKELFLGLRSTQRPPPTQADHDIPAGMNMGKALPLLGVARAAPASIRVTSRNARRKSPRRGCSSTGAAVKRSVPVSRRSPIPRR